VSAAERFQYGRQTGIQNNPLKTGRIVFDEPLKYAKRSTQNRYEVFFAL
jgi:hypothetical protein